MNAPVHFDPASDAYTTPLDQIDVSDPKLFQEDIYYPYFARLRREDPVHYRKDGMYGSFWSVTKFKDIMSVETRPDIYSSAAKLGGITILDRPMEFRRPSFISMDPPRHHLSFGFGVHRCVGTRLAEMQLIILWEEIMKRFPVIELIEEPKRIYSNFIHGIAEMKVRIPA